MTNADLTQKGRTPKRTHERIALVAACVFVVAVVGYIDAVTTPLIAFSIFYLPAIVVATWVDGRQSGMIVAAAAAAGGLGADLWTMHGSPQPFPFINFGLRLILYTLTCVVVAQLRDGVAREQVLTEQAREAAAQLAAANEVKDELMRAVVQDVRAPLGDIYASAVTLQMAASRAEPLEERQALVKQIAEASKQMSDVVNTLVDAEKAGSPTLSSVG